MLAPSSIFGGGGASHAPGWGSRAAAPGWLRVPAPSPGTAQAVAIIQRLKIDYINISFVLLRISFVVNFNVQNIVKPETVDFSQPEGLAAVRNGDTTRQLPSMASQEKMDANLLYLISFFRLIAAFLVLWLIKLHVANPQAAFTKHIQYPLLLRNSMLKVTRLQALLYLVFISANSIIILLPSFFPG